MFDAIVASISSLVLPVAFDCESKIDSTLSVRVYPGQTVFTVIPSGAISSDKALAHPSTPFLNCSIEIIR